MATQTRYEFTVNADESFLNKMVDLPRFEKEIRESAIVVALAGSPQVIDVNCCIDFRDALTSEDLHILEAIVKAHTGEPLPVDAQKVIVTGAEAPLVVKAMPPAGLKSNQISVNWCDRTTWWYSAAHISNETPTTTDPERKIWKLAHQYVIDAYHGKITGEENIPEYRVVVYVGGAPKLEQDPHSGSGGDYVVDYAGGTITFLESVPVGSDPVVSYYRENGSTWVITPNDGGVWKLKGAECQFSEDVEMNDSIIYELWAYDPNNFPAKMMVASPDCYKTIYDFINDANKAYPLIPPLGGSGWRGSKKSVYVFAWDFQTTTDLDSTYGVELRVRLEHDTPFGGTFATGTFYFIR